jgi:hypothetical protein
MNNPVVVFFDKNRAQKLKGFMWPDGITFFPVGWNVDGIMKDPTKDECNYEVLLLDDTKEVPDLRHTNKDPHQTLLVIAHNNSTINTDPVGSEVLMCWGRPYVCWKFSHTQDEFIIMKITDLFNNQSNAQKFASIWRNANHLELYDHLAAVCQIRMIDPTAQTDALWTDISGQLPDNIRLALEQENTNEERLEFIRTAAAPLAP